MVETSVGKYNSNLKRPLVTDQSSESSINGFTNTNIHQSNVEEYVKSQTPTISSDSDVFQSNGDFSAENALLNDSEAVFSSEVPSVGPSSTTHNIQFSADASSSVPPVVECIELDDDDDVQRNNKNDDVTTEPTAKKRSLEDQTSFSILSSEQRAKSPELTSIEALLDKLEKFVCTAIENGDNLERKMLDALLGAINIQVHKEPLSVRKLILDKQLVLPNTISIPPSQVVDLLVEHDPELPLGKVIVKLFGEDRPKITDAERRDKQLLKANHHAPLMTKLLMDIGQDLVQESTYSDIVHAKNLPETPKNMETYKQVAQQLKPVLEALKNRNDPYKLKQSICQVCSFKTDSMVLLSAHRQAPHFDSRKYQCGLCPEFFTNENMIIQHYLKQHYLVPGKEESLPKNPCPCCDEDFMYKGQRDQHLKICRRDFNRVRHIMAPANPQDINAINEWMWPRPAIDPTILLQQQVAQRQQAEKIQKAQLAQQQQLQKRNQFVAHRNFLAQQQQAALILQQQRLRAAQAVVQQANKMNSYINNPSILAAMQEQIRAAAAVAAAGMRSGIFQNRCAAPSNVRMPASMVPNVTNKGKTSQSSRSVNNAVASSSQGYVCEICDTSVPDRDRYLNHLQLFHKQMIGKNVSDMHQGAPLACSRCHDRFWTYEGLERHLVMAHGLVTSDLLTKAQQKEDGGRCKLCGKQYAFNMLQHLVTDHSVKLCSAEIMYSCDVCSFKCSSYTSLEAHLSTVHPKNPAQSVPSNNSAAGPSQGRNA